MAAFIVITPLLFTALFAAFGLALNLKIPNLNWTSETAAVKQSFSVLITLFSGWILPLAFGVIYYLLFMRLDALWFFIVYSAVVTVLCAVCLTWLKKRGTLIYKSL